MAILRDSGSCDGSTPLRTTFYSIFILIVEFYVCLDFILKKFFTNELFDVFKQDAAIVVYLKRKIAIISSWINGGYQEKF